MEGDDTQEGANEKENAEPKDTQSVKNDLEVKQASQENLSKITEIKARLSAEIENVEQNITEIGKMKQESIEKIELKKKELRELSGTAEVCKEKDDTMREMKITGKEIEDRKISITLLDQTIDNLDKQIAQIQAEHDKATADLDLKKRKLNEQLRYYDALNERLTALLELLQKESQEHEQKLNDLLEERKELLKRTDLSETTLNKMLAELDSQIETLNREHEEIMNAINKRLSDMEVSEPSLIKEFVGLLEDNSLLLTEEQIKELEDFELSLLRKLHPKMTNEERLAILRRGLQITPSGRIITKDDRVITLTEARLLGLLGEEGEEEEEEELEAGPELSIEKIEPTRPYYASTPSEISSTEKSSSLESELDTRDIDYLKRVFGKSLSLALAEITAVQPSDPIHYLAHWFIKYRYNQEIDEVKRLELQALMIEREKLEAERWHAELEEEAYLAVLEALFRAENIIMQQDYERMALLQQETEGEYELDSFNPMEFFT